MNITEAQLRKIIREEAQRALREAGPAGPGDFYLQKARGLREALGHIGAAKAAMQRVSVLDLQSPEGEDADVRSVSMDIEAVEGFLQGLLDATQAMADSAGAV